jgi:PadR family transcriptional regulator, regulatory protein PadR
MEWENPFGKYHFGMGPCSPRRYRRLTTFYQVGTFLVQGSFIEMTADQKFNPIRKGLLEFLILQIISADKVYVADMMKRLQETDFATQEGTLYPLLSKMRREEFVDYEWQESDSGPPRKYYKLTAKGKSQLAEFKDYWAYLNTTINQLGR